MTDIGSSPPNIPTDGHDFTIVGYDFTDPANPYFYIQNSHSTDPNMKILMVDYNEWAPTCNFGNTVGHFSGVKPAAPWNHSDPQHPFRVFAENGDLDLDGVPDTSDPDIDGDWIFNRWDCAPYNPHLFTDLDRDGFCDNRLNSQGRLDLCLAHCEGLSLRPGVNQDLASCQSKCNSYDRCMISGIKNRGDDYQTGCTFHCLMTDNQWNSNPGCDPDANLADDYPCCSTAEQADLAQCETTYKNLSNVDTDGDSIGDVCEYWPAVSELTFEFVPSSTLEYDPYGQLVETLNCDDRPAQISFWTYGGTLWNPIDGFLDEYMERIEDNKGAKTIAAKFAVHDTVDIGACGCIGPSCKLTFLATSVPRQTRCNLRRASGPGIPSTATSAIRSQTRGPPRRGVRPSA